MTTADRALPSLAGLAARPAAPGRANGRSQDRVDRPEFLLRAHAGAAGHLGQADAERRDGVHRPVGLRQEHVPAHAQPDERHHPRRARRGPGAHRRRRHLRQGVDVVQLRRRVGMVFQKSNPFPKSIFENVAYGLRINRMAELGVGAGRPGRGEPEAGGALGRSQGPAARLGAGALGRPAAAAVHRPGAGRAARHPADGRAGVGARPDRDAAHRGAGLRPEEGLHDRDRHAQHAAGGARLRLHRLLLARTAGRVRPHREASSRRRPRS